MTGRTKSALAIVKGSRTTMSIIHIEKSLHLASPDNSASVQVADIAHASKDMDILLEAFYSGTLRRSEDNGSTWEAVEEWETEESLKNGLILERSLPMVFCDPENGLVLRLFTTQQYKPGTIAWDYSVALGPRTSRMFTQVSHDEGRTWSQPEQILLSGEEYDTRHWMDGVYYGKNGRVTEGTHFLKSRDGSVLVPFNGARLFGDDILNPEIPPERSNPDGNVEWVSGCLIGQWRGDGSGLDWTQSSLVTLPRKYSCDGADEPSIDYLPDGRLFMVLRARTYPHTCQELPGLHYYSLSSDDGRTWSECEPLLFDDGSLPMSPACLANVFRSSKNGRFYMITNFCDVPPVNCDPRTKLQIAEIDTETLRVRKDTVTIIEQQNKAVGQPDEMRFSNFRWYEDRETKDIVLFLTGGTATGDPALRDRVPPHAYRYDLRLPE